MPSRDAQLCAPANVIRTIENCYRLIEVFKTGFECGLNNAELNRKAFVIYDLLFVNNLRFL
jgi:hypothetical protein